MSTKITGPRYDLEVGKPHENYLLKVHRDRVGNVEFFLWDHVYTGERKYQIVAKPNLRELKRLRDWLTRVINFVERP